MTVTRSGTGGSLAFVGIESAGLLDRDAAFSVAIEDLGKWLYVFGGSFNAELDPLGRHLLVTEHVFELVEDALVVDAQFLFAHGLCQLMQQAALFVIERGGNFDLGGYYLVTSPP